MTFNQMNQSDALEADALPIKDALQIRWIFNQTPKRPFSASPPANWQTALAHEAVRCGRRSRRGANHPTQIQGAEIYRDRPIAYALKDLNFDNATPTELGTQYDTAALKSFAAQSANESRVFTGHDPRL